MIEIQEYKLDSERHKKNANSDRILVLERMPGKSILNTKGVTDNRLFTGDNKLHAIFNPDNSMWYLKFDAGHLPEQFKQWFTSFSKLLSFARQYYEKRNVQIKEVIY